MREGSSKVRPNANSCSISRSGRILPVRRFADGVTVRIVHMRCLTLLRSWRDPLLATAFALAGVAAVPALAQAPTAPAQRPAAQTGAPAKPPVEPSISRKRIELPAAERKALEEGETARPAAGPTQEELVPSAADAKSPPPEEPVTRIEQIRTSNRISEIRVTPALTGHTYTMTNREGQQSTSATGASPGLSVPKFFTFEFGRTDERPVASAPPPPTSSTPR